MIRVIGIGDNVCDKYQHLGMMFPGGQALNFSVYCRQELNEAAYIGVFGSDETAKHIIETLEKLQIDFSHARHYKGENGYAVIDLKDGDRVFVTSNKGGVLRLHPLKFTDYDLKYIESFDIIHTSNNSYIDEELPKLAALNNRLSYDFSGSWKDKEHTCTICKYIDFGFISASELSDEQTKLQLTNMHEWGCDMIIATMGERGALLYDGNRFYTITPKIMKPIDTLGAGDSFASGFLISFVEKTKECIPKKASSTYEKIIQDALENGTRFSAKTCMVQGAFGYGTKLI